MINNRMTTLRPWISVFAQRTIKFGDLARLEEAATRHSSPFLYFLVRKKRPSGYIDDEEIPAEAKLGHRSCAIPLHMKGRNTVLKFSADCNAADLPL